MSLPGSSLPLLHRLTVALTVVACAVPTGAAGQVVASERATLKQVISGTEIELDYSRPSARGRTELFGGQVPWGQVWTPGANLNTTLRLSKGITFDGHDVEPGVYGVWIQVLEDGPWRLMLHEDTTRFHTMHPEPDEGILNIPVERSLGEDFVETLTLDVQDIRAASAQLVLAWGNERVAVDLGIDPGYVLIVSAEEAAPFVGQWTLDQSAMVPPEAARESMRASMPPEELVFFDRYVEVMGAPQLVDIRHGDDGMLYLSNPAVDDIMNEVQGEGFATVLMVRAEGIFEPGILLYGELAFAGDQGLYEFDFDDAGRAVSFVIRDPSDAIVGRATREGGD